MENLDKVYANKIAEEYGLITATKKDSTGICFIGERHFREFLENYLPNIPGDIVNIETTLGVETATETKEHLFGEEVAIDYIIKPFQPARIKEAVKKAVS